MPSKHKRPTRLSVTDELGRSRTLVPGAFEVSGQGEALLILGLGPDPLSVPVPPGVKTIYFLECPDFSRQMPADWHRSIPGDWTGLHPEEISAGLLQQSCICWQPHNLRLFPSFWSSVLASIRTLQHPLPAARQNSTVLVPGDEKDLLLPEVEQAFATLGFSVIRLDPQHCLDACMDLLGQFRPALFLSINFKGLDRFGQTAALLNKADVPVAVWCVDNPFHLLTALESPYWKDLDLFVTDDWFLGPLRHHGARSVHHLPLAVAPEIFRPAASQPWADLEERLVFVGRSEFPNRAAYFGSRPLPEGHLEQARESMHKGHRPDFAWWSKRLNFNALWPGNNARAAGLGAVTSGLQWRAEVLRGLAATHLLTVFGDAGWKDHLPPNVDLRGSVDYYGPLANIYTRARYSLNITGMLLPHGLTQRHFDVWSVGGCLITDHTPGLDLFPRELVRPIRFTRTEDIPPLLQRFEKDPILKQDLTRAWQSLIHAEHTYRHRLERLLNILEINTQSA